MMLCLDQQDRARLQVAQKHPTLNFRLHNIVVDLIAKIRVGPEHLDMQLSVHEGYQAIDVCIIHPEAAEGKYFSSQDAP